MRNIHCFIYEKFCFISTMDSFALTAAEILWQLL